MDANSYRDLLEEARMFITGEMRLQCLPEESDRACLNRCKADLLRRIDEATAQPTPEHGGWKHYPSYKDATVALAQGNYFTGIKVNGVAFAYFMEHDGSVTAMKLPVASPFATHGEGSK